MAVKVELDLNGQTVYLTRDEAYQLSDMIRSEHSVLALADDGDAVSIGVRTYEQVEDG